jgi:hypothetical protein
VWTRPLCRGHFLMLQDPVGYNRVPDGVIEKFPAR